MIGNDIVTRLRLLVNDADAIRWVDAEILLWINDASRYVALKRPDLVSVNGDHTLVAGTRQSIAGLTPKGLRMLDVVRNKSASRGMRLVDREVLDTQLPNWHGATQGAPTNWVYDNRDPTTYYVYPPASAGQVLEIIYGREPVVLANVGEFASVTLSIPDICIDPMVNYVLYRMYGKDADFAQNSQLSAGYLAACNAALDGKARTDVAFSPDLNAPGGRPTAGAAAGGA